MALALDAVVLADDPRARTRIAGLTACERAVRVARRVGAGRVFVVGVDGGRDALPAWGAATTALLVIRADQLVHTPLASPLVEAAPVADGIVAAVGPDGAYAGALVAHGAAAGVVIAALARGDTDDAIVAAAPVVTRVEHGAIARHAIGTPAERAAAHRLLYRILIKPQDNAITRYLYRPVSFPLTRLLVHTPITPNQVSALVGVLVMIGCWLTASASIDRAILGTAIILVGSYVDCCDGEIARVKLLSSRFGAWMDTIVDELSTIGYMVALGIHCHLRYGPLYLGDLGVDPWLALTAGSLVTYCTSLYFVYFNIIVAVGSANSQDYVARFVLAPGATAGTARLAPAPVIATTSSLPPWVATVGVWISYIPRRDFLTWLTLVMAIAHQTHVMFGLLVLGGLITFIVLVRDHAHLRGLRRTARAAGQTLQPPR